MSPDTFGNTPAAIVLAKMLEEKASKGLKAKVSKFVCDFFRDLEAIKKMQGHTTRHKVIRMFGQQMTEHATKKFEILFRDSGMDVSFLNNVIIGRTRKAMDESDVWCRLAYGNDDQQH